MHPLYEDVVGIDYLLSRAKGLIRPSMAGCTLRVCLLMRDLAVEAILIADSSPTTSQEV
ncbi:hypothetical protein HB770_22065 [Rhizobium leguminosarum bv. viciae]|jgi:hypothetical protein|uniref:Uncharacterized protein n=1 Tax=Rhizobium leguminosarum bv. viciae TaxID=387 RepID=A0A7G6RLB3_RHILV|nr:hypothetical protein HB770_22065 [Rhizobium leguminosarum bv. viciae]